MRVMTPCIWFLYFLPRPFHNAASSYLTHQSDYKVRDFVYEYQAILTILNVDALSNFQGPHRSPILKPWDLELSLKELDALKPCRVPNAECQIRILNSKCDAGAGGGAWCGRNFQQLFSILQLLGLLRTLFWWFACCFFFSWNGSFQMGSHCRGWGQASPAKRFTWTWWKSLK